MADATLADFRENFPEMDKATDALVQAKLDQAIRRLDASVWGDTLADGQLYLAAHLVAISPFGRNAKLVAKDGSTIYGEIYERLAKAAASGFRVAGDWRKCPVL